MASTLVKSIDTLLSKKLKFLCNLDHPIVFKFGYSMVLSGPRPAPPLTFFFIFLFSLSVGAPFSSRAPGHCPPMPPIRYATVKDLIGTSTFYT